MKILRESIRKIILEMDYFEKREKEKREREERMREFRKYHDDERAEAAVQELRGIFDDPYSFKAGPWGNEFDVHEMYHRPEPDCEVRIRVYRMWGAIMFDEIETTPTCEGKGYAREVVQIIKDVAKKHQVLVRLEAKAFNQWKSENRMSSGKLRGWYERMGFKWDGNYMVYKW